MNRCHLRDDCNGCSERIVCHCLQVSEGEVVAALATGEVHTLKDLRRATGAGNGCMCCHRDLRRLLELHLVEVPCRVAS
jgi:bacterioferritin-associated ferredoxin